MSVELERSQFAHETLNQSTAALKDLGEQYTSLDDLLSNSKTLLRTLIQSQKSDTWYLETALYVIVATIIWLVFRRFLYGPLWWFVWFPFKLSYRIVYWSLSTVGVVASASAKSSSSSTSLKIQPSATDRPPARAFMPHKPGPQIHVGGGGKGAPMQHPPPQASDPSPEDSLSRQVGQMAEESQKAEKQEQQEQVVRGDGTVLPPRDPSEPGNPKKRMMEGESGNVHKRDEL